MDLEYLKKVGINKDYERFLRDKRNLLSLELDACLSNDKMKHTVLEAHKVKFDAKYSQEEKKIPFLEQVASVENYFQSLNSIDVKTLSSIKYFTYVKIMNEQIKKQQKQDLSNG